MTDRELITSLQAAVIQLQGIVVRLQGEVHMIKYPTDTRGAPFVAMVDLLDEISRPH